MTKGSAQLTGTGTIAQFKKCGFTHIVWLPDSEGRFMYDVIMSQREIALIPVCREGEAIGIATGLLLGGKKPVVLHQNTGFFESGDSVRGLALDLNLPLLIVIGYRGWRQDRHLTDSAAIFIEPILDAWRIKYYLVETENDLYKIPLAYQEAQENEKPVVVLIGRGSEL